MSTDGDDLGAAPSGDERIQPLDIRDEMRTSYLTYAMSVIISRALPDVRDGLKPSQRRILVAMNDLNLGASSSRVKCAKISGDTSGNYHPHGENSVYPTLVRMAQDWVMREVLIDKQGNFGSLAGLPPAAMRYTEARLSAVAGEMLDDLNRDTVDFVRTYDQARMEPTVLPARFPNLLVNGSTGIAVGMATSIPPHNLREVCQAVVALIDDPDCTIDEILDLMPGPDFPTGGIICGRSGIRLGYMTGRSTLTLRARTHFATEKNSDVIVVTEIPFLETRDRIRERLEQLVRDDRVKGISRIIDLTDRKTPSWQVNLHIVLKRDADKEVVLNQLFQYSNLQTTVSMILLALVGNRPKLLTVRELLQEFLRHRVTVIRRRTEFLLAEARKRKHTVEGLIIAQIDIDQVISTIRNSPNRAEAKVRLQKIEIPAELVARALGDGGFAAFQTEQGVRDTYSLSANQSEAIVSMQLGSLANLERERLNDEHKKLLEEINECLHLLSDEAHILAVIREDMLKIHERFGSARRTEISDEELGDVTREDLIAEEPMVVTLSQRGYVKRLPLNTYQAQNRGGKGIIGAKSADEDPIAHLFVASTHDYLLFFTDRGKVHWRKVYDLPLQGRTAKGRALVNLLSLDEDEQVAACFNVREFDEERFLIMATRNGLVKKTPLAAYGRPMKGGIIAIRLDDGDSLIKVAIVSPDEDILLATRNGMAIRFSQSDARAMGRNTRGVKGISLAKEDHVVGMVIANPVLSLLTICENGYGKRTSIGFIEGDEDSPAEAAVPPEDDAALADDASPTDDSIEDGDGATIPESGSDDEAGVSGTQKYRRQRRGGKGLRDIKTTKRNGPAIAILAVDDGDEVLMVTERGKIQRIRAEDVSLIGRNTQGVRIMNVGDDVLASVARIPAEVIGDAAASETSDVAGENDVASPIDVTPPTDDVATGPVADDVTAADDADDVEGVDDDAERTDPEN